MCDSSGLIALLVQYTDLTTFSLVNTGAYLSWSTIAMITQSLITHNVYRIVHLHWNNPLPIYTTAIQEHSMFTSL